MTKAIHYPTCAIILDVAETADWDDPEYVPPKCTCTARADWAAARYASRAPAAGGARISDGWQAIGPGNFRSWCPGAD